MPPDTLNPSALPFWIDIGVAFLCGAILGVDRQLRGKPAGVSTCILVVFGTDAFINIGSVMGAAGGDPTRVLGQVVTGIGFIGAGVIMAQGGRVTGVTTAAAIWVLAAVGAMVGAGLYAAAIAVTLLMVAVINLADYVEPRLKRLGRQGDAGEGSQDGEDKAP